MLGTCCGVQCGAAPEKVSSLPLNAAESPGKSRGAENHQRVSREEVEEKGLNIGIGLAGGPPKPSEEEAQKKSSKEPKEARRGSKDSKGRGGEGLVSDNAKMVASERVPATPGRTPRVAPGQDLEQNPKGVPATSGRTPRLLNAVPGQDLKGIATFTALKKKLEGMTDSGLAAQDSWDKLVEALQKCGYKDGDFGIFIQDLGTLGIASFFQSLPSDVTPRSWAIVSRVLDIFCECGLAKKDAPTPRATASSAPSPVTIQDATDQAAPRFSATGQQAIRSLFWLKGAGIMVVAVSVGFLLGLTQKLEPLNEMDIFSADDDDTGSLLLKTILPMYVVWMLSSCNGPLSARVGADMLQEMSNDSDPKDAARSCLSNAALMLALFLTMILATWQQDVGFDTRFAMWYRCLNLLAAEAAIRGLTMCILVMLYMEPLDSQAAMQFACDNLSYIGEPVSDMITCIVYFANVLILWEFGTDGIWIGIFTSICLGYSILRMSVVFQYLSNWKNPNLSNEERAMRQQRTERLTNPALKVQQ